jgi:hypothetical protein
MSLASLDATIAKLNSKGIPYRLETSPYTGNLAIYTQTISPSITPPGSNVNITDAKISIDNYVYQHGVDGYCDDIGFRGGILSDTYYPSIWIGTTLSASGQLVTLDTEGKQGSLPLTGACLVVLAAIALAITLLVVGYLVWSRDSYAYMDTNTGQLVNTSSWTNFMSHQNAAYWFVCGKDGYGVGLRSQYAQASDVPQTEVDRWKEHCDQAADLSAPDQAITNIIWALAIGAVAIGGVYIAVKVVPGMVKKKSGLSGHPVYGD